MGVLRAVVRRVVVLRPGSAFSPGLGATFALGFAFAGTAAFFALGFGGVLFAIVVGRQPAGISVLTPGAANHALAALCIWCVSPAVGFLPKLFFKRSYSYFVLAATPIYFPLPCRAAFRALALAWAFALDVE